MAKSIRKTCPEHGAFTTTGPAGKCPECKVSGSGKEKAMKGPRIAGGQAKTMRNEAPAVPVMPLVVDFTGYDALRVQIEQQARQEFRTVGSQILYLLVKAFDDKQ